MHFNFIALLINSLKKNGAKTGCAKRSEKQIEPAYLWVVRGREPPDAMSHRYADTILPDLLDRPLTEPPLCRNEHAQYIKMCLCNTGGFLNLCFKFK